MNKEENKKSVLERHREWQRNNKDKVREYQKRYKEKHPEKFNGTYKKYKIENEFLKGDIKKALKIIDNIQQNIFGNEYEFWIYRELEIIGKLLKGDIELEKVDD